MYLERYEMEIDGVIVPVTVAVTGIPADLPRWRSFITSFGPGCHIFGPDLEGWQQACFILCAVPVPDVVVATILTTVWAKAADWNSMWDLEETAIYVWQWTPDGSSIHGRSWTPTDGMRPAPPITKLDLRTMSLGYFWIAEDGRLGVRHEETHVEEVLSVAPVMPRDA